jgi:hypothetical protein
LSIFYAKSHRKGWIRLANIITKDYDLVRGQFSEAAEHVGIPVIFYECSSDSSDLYNDPINKYKNPVRLHVILDEQPKTKILKELGWFTEDTDIKPILMYLPIYKNTHGGLLKIDSNCLVEIEYVGIGNKKSKFRVTDKKLDSVYGNYWVCKVVPERLEQFEVDDTDGYEYLKVE